MGRFAAVTAVRAPIADVSRAPGRSGRGVEQRLCFLSRFWCFASESVLAYIAADLVGPDVKFHNGKLNLIHV